MVQRPSDSWRNFRHTFPSQFLENVKRLHFNYVKSIRCKYIIVNLSRKGQLSLCATDTAINPHPGQNLVPMKHPCRSLPLSNPLLPSKSGRNRFYQAKMSKSPGRMRGRRVNSMLLHVANVNKSCIMQMLLLLNVLHRCYEVHLQYKCDKQVFLMMMETLLLCTMVNRLQLWGVQKRQESS